MRQDWYVPFVVIGVLLCLLAVPVFEVFRTSRQAELYRRQGIEISWWEVAIGIRPAAAPEKTK